MKSLSGSVLACALLFLDFAGPGSPALPASGRSKAEASIFWFS